MGEARLCYIDDILQVYTVRMVPEAYRDLAFDAKTFDASKYVENVWSPTLLYDTREPAAVGPDNKPLHILNGIGSITAGNVVSYKGTPVKDLERLGFRKDGSCAEQRAKTKEIRKAINWATATVKADAAETPRIKFEQDVQRFQKDQARIRKMEQGPERLKKMRKLKEDRQRAAAEDAAEKKVQEEADRKAKEEAGRKAKKEADQRGSFRT